MSHSPIIHRPEIYEVETLEQAKRVIVTPEKGATTEERWEKETAYLTTEIGQRLNLGPGACVLDYGCGIGRVSKALIDAYGCRVVGVDASRSMRLLSPDYVLSERFTVWSPETLAKMAAKGFFFQKAICLWVLQHVLRPDETIQLIDSALAPDAFLYLLNQDARCVPTNRGYVNDGRDVGALVTNRFEVLDHSRPPESVTTPIIARGSSIFLLRSRRVAR